MKSNSSRLPSQVLLGAVVICVGVLLMLDNLDIVNFRHAVGFWPVVFIVFGVLMLNEANSNARRLAGVGLVVIGVVMTLNRMGIIHATMHMLWPLILIGLGIFVVVKAFTKDGQGVAKSLPGADGDDVINVAAVLGGFQSRIMSDDFKGGEVTAVMGGCELDLRQASIRGEAVLNVFAVCGGIEIKVPTDWSVSLQGTPIVGGFEEKTVAPAEGNKRLVIRGYAILGGVNVRN